MKQNRTSFLKGLRSGIPISLGYFFVSFGFGIFSVNKGVNPWVTVLMSLTNLTSAGQVAGVGIILANGSFLEMALTQFTINIRYFLMGTSLTQKLDEPYPMGKRIISAFGVTDEIFGVASTEKEPIKPAFMFGIILLPYIGWGFGTFLGAVAGNILPEIISDSLGISIYGMFAAILIPPARKERGVLFTLLVSIFLSCLFYYVPFLSKVPSGYSLMITAIAASVAAAFLFPRKTDGEEEAQK